MLRRQEFSRLITLVVAATFLVSCSSSAPSPPRSLPSSEAPGITPPVMRYGNAPEYTAEALKQGVQGTVSARCVVEEDGVVTQCQILESIPLLDQAVLDALATWRCKPALRDGEAIAVKHVFRLRLKPPHNAPAADATGTRSIPFDESRMTRPTVIVDKQPIYTVEALMNRVQGSFAARCTLTIEGEVKNCIVVKPIPLMDGAILDALTQRRYTPALLDGKPVQVTLVFNVELRLPTRSPASAP